MTTYLEGPPAATPTSDLPTPARVLAIGAHPDDIDFGCGATLAKWAAAGSEVAYLVLTDGSKGTWDPHADKVALIATRREEQRAAAARVGARAVHFLDNVDGELDSGLIQREAVCRVIRTVRPDVVLGHDPWRAYRLHPDHRHAGFLATEGIVAARDPHFFPEQGIVHHRPSHLLLWEAQVADHLEDVDGFLEAKVEALLAHRTQWESTMSIGGRGEAAAEAEQRATFEDRIRRRASEAGAAIGFALGEAFKRIDHL